MGIGGAIAGILQSRAANRATDAQTAASNQQLELQGRIYDENVARFAPYEAGGRNALNALMFELGLANRPTFGGTPPEITVIPGSQGGQDASFTPIAGNFGLDQSGNFVQLGTPSASQASADRYSVGGQVFDTRDQAQAFADANPTGGAEYQGYSMTPGNQMIMQEGLDSVDASAAARGGLYSGATLQALDRTGQEYANRFYDNYLNRLTGLASSGQNAAGQGAAAGANYAQGASNALDNIGNAQAAGAIAQGNAWNNAIGNGIGLWQYQNSLNNGGGSNNNFLSNMIFGQGSLFGGNSWG